jgi:hypothetical protein
MCDANDHAVKCAGQPKIVKRKSSALRLTATASIRTARDAQDFV